MTWLDFVAEQWMLVGLLAVLIAAFLVYEKRKGGSTLSQHQATRLVNSGAAVILDVRNADEYKSGHIVDSLNIPYADLTSKFNLLQRHKSKQIIVVDKLGQQAGAAGKVLRENGFNAARMQGGIAEWTHQNLPLVKA